MGYIEIIWAIAIAAWAALFGFGGVVMSSTPPEFKNARKLFWFSPIPLIVADIMWILTTDKSLLERLIISGLIGAIALIGASESLRWAYKREANQGVTQETPKPETNEPIDGSVFIEIKNMAPFPVVMPPEGIIEARFLSPAALTNGIQDGHPFLTPIFMHGSHGSKINWPVSATPRALSGNILEITNDTGGTIFELTIPIRVVYGSAPNQRTFDSNIIITRLDPGLSNHRVIYILNQSPDGGSLNVNDIATAMKLGDSVMKKVRITKPQSFISALGLIIPFTPIPEEPKKKPQKKPHVSKPE
jgi:hypothetical protein